LATIERLFLQNAEQMPTLDEIARDPVRAAELSAPERIVLIAQCAGVLLALSAGDGAVGKEPLLRRAHQEPVERLLGVPEAAAALRLSPGYVYELLRCGRLTGVHVGKFWKIRPAALAAFIAENEKKGLDVR